MDKQLKAFLKLLSTTSKIIYWEVDGNTHVMFHFKLEGREQPLVLRYRERGEFSGEDFMEKLLKDFENGKKVLAEVINE